MGAEMNHWYLQLYQGHYPVEPDRLPEDGYHLSEDLVDNAIAWVENQQAITPERPFFAYVALSATHAPFHVAASGAASTPAVSTLAGTPSARPLASRRSSASCRRRPSWRRGPKACRTGTSSTRPSAGWRRFMETYAGFAEHADVQIGRLVDALDELGVLDDTLASTCSATVPRARRAAGNVPRAPGRPRDPGRHGRRGQRGLTPWATPRRAPSTRSAGRWR